MTHPLSPLEVALAMIGSARVVAEVCGLDRTTVLHWQRQTKSRSSGDIPSDTHKRALLRHARAHGIPLTAEHLIFGAPAAEIEALLAARAAAPIEQVAAE